MFNENQSRMGSNCIFLQGKDVLIEDSVFKDMKPYIDFPLPQHSGGHAGAIYSKAAHILIQNTVFQNMT